MSEAPHTNPSPEIGELEYPRGHLQIPTNQRDNLPGRAVFVTIVAGSQNVSSMKDFATLSDVLEVKNITLSTLRPSDEKDNFGNTVAIITDPNALMAIGNNQVFEGKTRLPLKYIIAKFIGADSRVLPYLQKQFNADLAKAQVNGTIGVVGENSSEEEIKTVIALKTDLKNRLMINLLRAAATLNLTYHKSEKVNELTGDISQSLKVGIDDIVVVLKDNFVKALDATIAEASTFNFD